MASREIEIYMSYPVQVEKDQSAIGMEEHVVDGEPLVDKGRDSIPCAIVVVYDIVILNDVIAIDERFL